MKLKIVITGFVLFLFASHELFAQKFVVPLEGFSRKKITEMYMEDGSMKSGFLGGFSRSKGLITAVKMKNPEGGKVKIDPSKISYMYLPPSNLAKFSAFSETLGDAGKWSKKTNYDTTKLNAGYVFFEKAMTQVKKNKQNLMLQLMNPAFSEKIKVYHDPFAKETASVGVGGVTLAGGLDKSYYVKKDDAVAYRVMKKNYDEDFKTLFGDNKAFMEKYGSDVKWSLFETHVYQYTEMSK